MVERLASETLSDRLLLVHLKSGPLERLGVSIPSSIVSPVIAA
jgi:hypothetical protein